jgi:hypothetical protein
LRLSLSLSDIPFCLTHHNAVAAYIPSRYPSA